MPEISESLSSAWSSLLSAIRSRGAGELYNGPVAQRFIDAAAAQAEGVVLPQPRAVVAADVDDEVLRPEAVPLHKTGRRLAEMLHQRLRRARDVGVVAEHALLRDRVIDLDERAVVAEAGAQRKMRLAAVREFEVFFDRYPNSALTPEVRAKWRIARSRLSEASYRVGLYYFRVRWYPGAIDRFKEVLKADPSYPERDAVYFYLAESLLKTDKKAEALPYFDRLVKEFDQSMYLMDARKRLEALSAQ